MHIEIIDHLTIQLSVTEKGDLYENAIVEKINEILKYEYELKETFTTFDQAKTAVDDALAKYNKLRIHYSCGRPVSIAAHERNGTFKKYCRKKNYKTCNKESKPIRVP